jgi:hypothetical protein
MTRTEPTASVRLRRHVPAVLFAAAAALGSSTSTATAAAEWDIGYYDECVAEGGSQVKDPVEWDHFCCDNSGGVWNAAQAKCEAPPHPGYQRTPPARVAPPAETTGTLERG